MSVELRKISRALLSVSDKSGLVELGQALARHGVTLISTGGTADALRKAGLTVLDVSEVTGFPEMLDGRLKTLHPKVHGGLLGKREDAGHKSAMAAHGIQPIDLVVVNLYPFEATVASGAAADAVIENIDIGGPAMIRSAAKNHRDVAVAVDPADFPGLIAELDLHAGATTYALRRRLAATAYARTAAYDASIAEWFRRDATDAEVLPHWLSLGGTRVQPMRYGENPHQQAALYRTGEARQGAATAKQLQGKELSFNNINDTHAAFELVAEMSLGKQPSIAIIKHANPCGAASATTLASAYRAALRTDPVSAFGGIIAASVPVDGEAAAEMANIFSEVIIAPAFSAEALAIFSKKTNLRLLETGGLPDPRAASLDIRPVAGGFLAQSRDNKPVDELEFKVVTKRQPTEAEWRDLKFAYRVVKHVKSNAIVFAKDGATVGVGAGQMSRVDAVRIAVWKALDATKAAGLTELLTKGSVAASDAFFPFPDGPAAIAESGATAIIQPGGSMRDDEVIKLADAHGIAMVFTGARHFRH